MQRDCDVFELTNRGVVAFGPGAYLVDPGSPSVLFLEEVLDSAVVGSAAESAGVAVRCREPAVRAAS